jgi:hypothetical protein
MASAKILISETVDDLKFDAAFLRVRSRDIADDRDAEALRKASEQIGRLSERLERLIPKGTD